MTDDKAIILSMKENVESGFRRLMKSYEQPVYWHIRRMVVSYDDAKDALQETFVRVFNFFDQYDEQKSLKAWIFRIATNEALRLLGKRRGKLMLSLDDMTTDIVHLEAEEHIDTSDAITLKLQRAIHSLPAKQQLTFNLRYYNDLSYDEIAEIAGSSAASMKANYHVAKEKIINFMNNND